MIIDFAENINTYKENILNNYGFLKYICPTCSSGHSLTRHCIYNRNITFFENDILIDKKIKILRVKCLSCNKTHAILPGDIIPYSIYSYSTIMRILFEYFLKSFKIKKLTDEYNISFQLIYFFISKFKEFLKECVFVLRMLKIINDILSPSISDVFGAILKVSLNKSFQKTYFNETQWVFLMKKFRNKRPPPITIGA
jgi:hypothetical protein